MITAFVDMAGLLMVIPLLPFYAKSMGGGGLAVGLLVSSFSAAQLLSSPFWGRFSDRYGRRPALLVGLAASAVAYVVFAYADSLWLLLVSRLVQGAGGGTVGVIQAYVADATEPRDRAKSLGWLSAATNVGVTIGPLIGSASLGLGRAAPGLIAAALCVANIVFAFFFLKEARVQPRAAGDTSVPTRPREALLRVLTRPGEAAPRLIWIYAIGMGAFSGFTAVLALFAASRFGFTERSIGYIFAWTGGISVLVRALFLGPLVDRMGEARLSRLGQILLGAGLLLLPFTWRVPGMLDLPFLGAVELRFVVLALVIALMPLGTAFTFPCVTALLSQVIAPRERGVMMGVQQTFGGATRVLGPLWAGWAFDHLGTPYPFWTSAVLVLGTLFLGFGIEARTGFGGAEPRVSTPRA
ncbi:MAG TPA: MFS transporter [Longimicrobium sp.]|jgi:multidrug resistance protein